MLARKRKHDDDQGQKLQAAKRRYHRRKYFNKNVWLRKISEKLGIKNYLSESKVSERS